MKGESLEVESAPVPQLGGDCVRLVVFSFFLFCFLFFGPIPDSPWSIPLSDAAWYRR